MPQIHRQHGHVVSSSGTPIPEGEEVPPIEFSDPEPPLEVCDQVLGGYVRCWGYVETAVAELFALLLGAHPIAARAVTASSMNPRTLREIMRVLAKQRISREQCATLERLLRRFDGATTSRNHIVHGTWRVAVKIKKPGPNSATGRGSTSRSTMTYTSRCTGRVAAKSSRPSMYSRWIVSCSSLTMLMRWRKA